MRGAVVGVAVILCSLPGSSAAEAGTITWSDTFTPTSSVLISKPAAGACTSGSILTSCSEFSYVHDLTDDGFVTPLDPSITLTGGLLDLSFLNGSGDKMKLTLEGTTFSNLEPVTFQFTGFSAVILATLANDGLLNVLIEHQGANNTSFSFLGGTFTLTGDQTVLTTPVAPAAVPEPATLLLLGTGLTAVAMRLRRRTS